MVGGDIPRAWIRNAFIINISILSKLIYKYNAMPIKIPAIFCGNRQSDCKIYMESERIKKSQDDL